MTDHARENGTMDGRLGALRSELETLETDMKVLVGDVEGIVDSRVHHAIRKAEDVAHGAYRLAEESVAHVANDVKDWTDGNLATVRRSVRARPLSLLALSLGTGALVGAIFSIARRRSPRTPL
ncbi:hypothetical protein [Rhizomicrobium electricum]|nr:hypothetical protein [Rhizomicrobium electricum]NIJ47962.1 hypothetical protein [Rhizomicrobium electricum]